MKYVFTVLILLILGQLQAQVHEEQEQGHKKQFLGFHRLDDTLNEEKSGVFVLPLIYYTPDTRWAFGAAGVYYFRMAPKTSEEHETRVSNVQFLTDYTQNKQLDVWGLWNIFTRSENFLLKGEARYRNFPDRFYGIQRHKKRKRGALLLQPREH